ncbi:MAG: ABC transporter permease, partial [Bdellovibrionales bacterium]
MRTIAWHCILGVGMGVAALVIVLSVMNGFNLTIRSRMLSVEPHLVFTQKGHPTPKELAKLRARVAAASRSGIQGIVRFESQDLILRSVDGTFGGAVARGYDHRALADMMSRVWGASRSSTAPPQSESAQLDGKELILGADLARGLGVFEGDQVILIPPETLLLPEGEIPRFQKFKVKSLISTQMPEFDSKLLFYNLDQFPKRMRSASRESGFEVRLNDPYEADAIKEVLVKQGYTVQTWSERDTSLYFALKMESLAMTL